MRDKDLIVPEAPPETPIVVAALYKFVALDDLESEQAGLQKICRRAKIFGTLLLAKEGINGTVSGTQSALQSLINYFSEHTQFYDIKPKYSFAKENSFYRMKVRLKKEIVTMGQPDIDPTKAVGRYVKPDAWNALISDPDTLLIDTRNAYEVAIGTFEGAVDPQTDSFREFPDWLDAYLAQQETQPKKIAMFCTGGIRCEKSTSYLVSKGFDNVFHLEGGILKYLETQPKAESKWRGDCFVFDQRVSVRHGLAQGDYDLCHACRMPITETDKQSSHYQAGISCPHCFGAHSEAQLQRYRERQKQIDLAKARGETHIGGDSDEYDETGTL